MAGSLIKIQEVDGTGSATVTLSGIDSTYDVYQVIGTNLKPATDDKDLGMRVTKDVTGTTTPQTTSNYDEATKNPRIDTTFSNSYLPNYTQWFPFSAIGNAAGEHANLNSYLFNFADASSYSFFTRENSQTVYDLDLFGMNGGGVYTVAEAHNGVQFFLESSTNFASGIFTLYGLKK